MRTLEHVLINYFIKCSFNLEKQSSELTKKPESDLKNAVWSLTGISMLLKASQWAVAHIQMHTEHSSLHFHRSPWADTRFLSRGPPSPLLDECRWVSLTGNGEIQTSSTLYVVFMWSPILTRGSLHALKSLTFTLLTGWKKVTRHKNMVCVCLCVRFCSFSRSILQTNASKHTWKSDRGGLNKQHTQIRQAPALGYKLIFMLSNE